MPYRRFDPEFKVEPVVTVVDEPSVVMPVMKVEVETTHVLPARKAEPAARAVIGGKNRLRMDKVTLRPEKVKAKVSRVKVKTERVKVKNDVKVDVFFHSGKSKIKVKTEFWAYDLLSRLRRPLISGAVTFVVAVMLVVGVNASGYKIGSEVLVDGKSVGVVVDQKDAYTAIEAVAEQVIEAGGEYDKEPEFVTRVVSPRGVTPVEDIKNTLLEDVDFMVEGVGVYIDDVLAFGMTSEEAAYLVLNEYKWKHAGVDSAADLEDDAVLDFDRGVEVRGEFLPVSAIRAPEKAIAMLEGSVVSDEGVYITGEDDTLWGIARKYDTTVEAICELNPGITEASIIRGGMEINVLKEAPLLGVMLTRTIEYIADIQFEIEKIPDDTMYTTQSSVTREGVYGKERVVARVTTLNGEDVDGVILETELLSEPVSQQMKVGTATPPPTVATGSFLRPIGGPLTSKFGSRWGRMHSGVDFGVSVGTPINAADGGVVVYSGWYSGYGNYIKISHENGYATAYAHCSSLLVSVGQRVAKGDVIAKSGNTGNSTGPHLHFEVLKNGTAVDPLGFIQ